ncbi:MAG: YoaK family protein [Janthinobacterium lividum]
MPLQYLRRLTGTERTERANRHLARILAGVAGAVNAGGFFAVGQYTSHMSGIVAAMADNLALGGLLLVLRGAGAVLSFISGAYVTTLMIRYSRQRSLKSTYSAPLVLEAGLLLVFALTGQAHLAGHALSWTAILLCFTMGVQNAMITKISGAVIRTTHLTGMITDIGISLGRVTYPGHGEEFTPANDEINRMQLHASLVLLFLAGGITGALGFRHVGFLFTVPFAMVLFLLGALPIVDDVTDSRRSRRGAAS